MIELAAERELVNEIAAMLRRRATTKWETDKFAAMECENCALAVERYLADGINGTDRRATEVPPCRFCGVLPVTLSAPELPVGWCIIACRNEACFEKPGCSYPSLAEALSAWRSMSV